SLNDHEVLIRLRRHRIVKRPENAPGGGIHGRNLAVLNRVQDAIHYNRSSFHLFGIPWPPDPLQLEVLHVIAIELSQRAIAHPGVTSTVSEPVLRLTARAKNPVGCDLRAKRRGG